MNQGYIKLYRKTIDSRVFRSEELFKLWALCLLKANHKKNWVTIVGIVEPIKILPGQFITGRFSLHQDYYQIRRKKQKSPITVWRWLLTLEKMGNLNVKTNNKYSIVTITNWHLYQSKESDNEQVNEQQMINRRTTDEQQMITNKNETRMNKNEKEDKDSGEPIIFIPVKGGNEFPIYGNMITEWQSLYPNIDIITELRAIRGWNISNKTRQKTNGGILKHVNSWLTRASKDVKRDTTYDHWDNLE